MGDCVVFRQAKYFSLTSTGLLQPIPIPKHIWDDITMDFIDGLPKLDNFSAILVVVDRLSKYAHFITLKHPYTTLTAAAFFLKETVC